MSTSTLVSREKAYPLYSLGLDREATARVARERREARCARIAGPDEDEDEAAEAVARAWMFGE